MEEIKEASKLYVLSLFLEISSGYAVMDVVVGVELRLLVRSSLLFGDSDFFDFLLMCFELLHLYLY